MTNSNKDQRHEPGLYSFDGKVFTKLEAGEGKKAPVTEQALESIKAIRAQFQRAVGVRVELEVIASALIGIAEIELMNDEEKVMQFLRSFAKANFQNLSNRL